MNLESSQLSQSITTTTTENTTSKPQLWSSYKISHPRIQHHIPLTVYVEHRSLFKIPSLPSTSFQSLGSVHRSCTPLTCIHFFLPTLPLLRSPPGSDMSLISQGPLLLSRLQQTVFFKNGPISAVVQILFPEPSHSPLRGMVCFSLLKFG